MQAAGGFVTKNRGGVSECALMMKKSSEKILERANSGMAGDRNCGR
jgi:hypothetical protein